MVPSPPLSPPLGRAPLREPLTLPAALMGSLRLNPEQFAQLCAANPEAVLELAADGSLIPMTPTGSETGPGQRWLDGLRQLHRLPAARWLGTEP